MLTLQTSIEVKPYTIGELAELYDISTRTLRRWLKPFQKEIGPRIGHYYRIQQVKVIFSRLDLPAKVASNDSFDVKQVAA